MRQRDKSNILYIHFHKNHGHQYRQPADLPRDDLILKDKRSIDYMINVESCEDLKIYIYTFTRLMTTEFGRVLGSER